MEASVTALLCRTACRVALYDVNFAKLASSIRTIRQFARQRRRTQNALSSRQFTGVSRRVARLLRRDTAKHQFFCNGRVFFQESSHMLGNAFVYEGTNGRVVQLVLRLRFKLRVDQFYGYDRRDTFTHVLTRQSVAVFQDILLSARVVDDFGERHLQAFYVRTAVNRVDVVCVAVNDFVVRFIVLNRHFAHGIPFLLFKIHGRGEQQFFTVFVQFFHERTNTAFIAERVLLLLTLSCVF